MASIDDNEEIALRADRLLSSARHGNYFLAMRALALLAAQFILDDQLLAALLAFELDRHDYYP